jgi:Condensation domain
LTAAVEARLVLLVIWQGMIAFILRGSGIWRIAVVSGMAQRILVPFEGEDSGVEALTWGQQEIWQAMQHQQSSLGVGGAFPLAEGSTVDGVASDLRFLMCRHSSLRTRLRFDADGRARQVLAASGEVPLEVVEAGDTDPAQVADAVYERYHGELFDYTSEWPVRWAVVLDHGTATHLVSEICHLATDGFGALVMLADLAARDPATGLAKGPVTAIQPLELARRQRSPAGRRQSDAALRYWERLLRTIPARRFPDSADKRQPRYWQAFYDSPGTRLAVQAIAARTRTDTATVLLAAAAVMLARVIGNNPVVVQLVVSNRFRPGLAESVSQLTQSGLCVIDVADITFDEAVARAWRGAVSACKHAYYDALQQQELLRRIGSERGEEIDIACFLNDRRLLTGKEPMSEPPEAQDVRAALPRSRLTWGYQQDRPSERLFIHFNAVPGTLNYEICADTHYVSPADMETCLRGLEAVAVQAALDPAARTGIRSTLVPS